MDLADGSVRHPARPSRQLLMLPRCWLAQAPCVVTDTRVIVKYGRFSRNIDRRAIRDYASILQLRS